MTSAEGPVPIAEEFAEAITYQSYQSQDRIEGVASVRLKKHRSENGWFAELFRLEGGVWAGEGASGGPIELKQLSASWAAPGRINAFHIHPRRVQNEIWTVLQGQLLVWLVDCRAASATLGVRQRVLLSGEEPTQLRIPSGVAHGYRAGPDGALLVYSMDDQFDAENPNEGRLPWDHFGEDLWVEDRG